MVADMRPPKRITIPFASTAINGLFWLAEQFVMVEFPDIVAAIPFGTLALISLAFTVGVLWTDLKEQASWARRKLDSRNQLFELQIPDGSWKEFVLTQVRHEDKFWALLRFELRNRSESKALHHVHIRIQARVFKYPWKFGPVYEDFGPLTLTPPNLSLAPLTSTHFTLFSRHRGEDRTAYFGDFREDQKIEFKEKRSAVIHYTIAITGEGSSSIKFPLTTYVCGDEPAIFVSANHTRWTRHSDAPTAFG